MTITSLSSISNVSEDAQLLETIERWTMRELKPFVREYDHEDRYPAAVVEQMKELGLSARRSARNTADSACQRRPIPR